MQAARTRFLAAILILVGCGADLDTTDKKGRSVYDLSNQQSLQAIEKGQRELRRKYLWILSTDASVETFSPKILSTIVSFLVR